MTEQDLSPISQASDFLGDLKAKLRDLSGFDTLANELTQNADDAGATINSTHTSEAKVADTFYDPTGAVLYVRYGNDVPPPNIASNNVPWLDIASSIAQIMNPDAEEGTIAGNLYIALNAPSTQKGEQALDKLKVPPFQADEMYEAALSTPAGMGGVDTSAVDDFDDNIVIDDGPIVNHVDEENQQEQAKKPDEPRVAFSPDKPRAAQRPDVKPTSPIQPTFPRLILPQNDRLFAPDTSGSFTTTNNADNARVGDRGAANNPAPSNGAARTPPPVPSPFTLYKPRQPMSLVKRPDLRKPAPHKNIHRASPRPAPPHHSTDRAGYAGRLRSYVFAASASKANQGVGGRNTEPIDKAGMARVLADEEQAGRFPEAMPHNNPGYDIYSLDAAGENERYIEVKSLSGDWRAKGVLVSAKQFITAQEFGPKFWLYVVERAEQNNFCITRIQNPAQRVNEYMFDDGWRDCTEITVYTAEGNADVSSNME